MPARRERAKAGTPSFIIDGAWRIREGEVVVPRAHIEKLISELERSKERIGELAKAVRQNYSIKNAEIRRLRGALEYIATNTTHYKHEWVRNYARAALEGK